MADVIVNIKGENKDAINKLNEVENKAKSTGSNAGSQFAQGLSAGTVALGQLLGSLATRAVDTVMGSLNAGIARADTLNAFPQVLANIGIASEDTDAALEKLVDGIDGLPTTLDSAAAAVQRFTLQNNDVGRSTDMFLALNAAMLGGGASAERQASALEQVSQAYSKGKPDMLEWKAMQEAMGPALQMVAQSWGMSVNDMGEALRSGSISMDDFMDTLMELQDEGVGDFASLEEQAAVSSQNIGTAMSNMSARIAASWTAVINAIGAGRIVEIINGISSSFKSFVVDTVAPYIEKLVGLFDALSASGMTPLEAMSVLLQKVSHDAGVQLTSLFDNLNAALPSILDGVLALGEGLVGSLETLLPVLTEGIGSLVTTLVEYLPEFVPLIIEGGIALFAGLLDALAEVAPTIIEALPELVSSLGQALIDNWPTIQQSSLELFMAIATAVILAAPDIIAALLGMLPQLAMMLINFIPSLGSAAGQLFATIGQAIGKAIPTILSALGSVIAQLPGVVLSYVANMVNAGYQLLMGVREGISNAVGAVVEAARSAVSSAISAAKDFLGISSPSKLARDLLGKNIVLGVAVGLEKNEDIFDEAVKKTFDLEPNVVGAGALTAPVYNVTFDGVSLNGVAGVTDIITGFLEDVERTVGSYVG